MYKIYQERIEVHTDYDFYLLNVRFTCTGYHRATSTQPEEFNEIELESVFDVSTSRSLADDELEAIYDDIISALEMIINSSEDYLC